MKKCDRDCFNCQYDDCIEEIMSDDERTEINERDDDLKICHRETPEQRRERARRYYYEHHEECKQKCREYYHSHKEKFREYWARGRRSRPYNPEKQHQYYLNRKKRKDQDG